ncbi:MAG: hypothetical protein ACOCZX_05045 [Candidatus Bipolaricaulota bacterium]
MFFVHNKYLTAILVLGLGLLNAVLLVHQLPLRLLLLGLTAISFSYLVFAERSGNSPDQLSLAGLLPGHFLLFIALFLRLGFHWVWFSVWSVLIGVTLTFDFLVVVLTSRPFAGNKLTLQIMYCIIWGAVLFLLQALFVNIFSLSERHALFLRVGLGIGGLVYVLLGLYRINQFEERRSTI